MGYVGKQSEQQKSVYAAQNTMKVWAKFASHDEVQAYVDSLTSANWWESRYARIERIDVVTAPDMVAVASHSKCAIGIGASRRTLNTVLHEVAHLIAGEAVGHEGKWVRTFLELTYFAAGTEKYQELYNAFADGNVEMD
jgi:putative metallohydrolase (TIGR04338 family)